MIEEIRGQLKSDKNKKQRLQQKQKMAVGGETVAVSHGKNNVIVKQGAPVLNQQQQNFAGASAPTTMDPNAACSK